MKLEAVERHDCPAGSCDRAIRCAGCQGDGTLLDNTMIFGLTDHGYARVHSLDGMAAMVAGRAGGKIKTGLHIKADGATIGRIGYTAQRVMGLDINSWGTRSNNTSKEFGEILV